MLKRLFASPSVQFFLGRLIGLYMRLVGWTTRWRMSGRENVERLWADGGGVITCVWHGRFMLAHKLWFGPGSQPAKMLISQSREGAVVTHAARTVGAGVIRGSAAKQKKEGGTKAKGGFEAMREMKRWLDSGGVMCLTPDGPKGPRMRAKLGPVQLAKLSGAPLLPMIWSTRWRKTMNSWDRFILPLPFGSGALVWGEPIHVPRDADEAAVEAARAALERELNRITREADALAGAPFIEPAPDAQPEPAPTQ